MSPSY
ncbi:hypothetical protein LINPERHAP2_LOCUS35186 [Linum perenne]